MTPTLLVLGFALLVAPLIESLWDPFWARVFAAVDRPSRRLQLLAVRMTGGFLLAVAVAIGLLWKVYHAPRSHPFLPESLVTCLGHGFEHGPGLLTVVFLFLATLGLGLVLLALFYPLPSFPEGLRRPDLEGYLAARGATARVEVLPGDEPACWSELTPFPRVLLLGGIETLLPEDELAAVLDHEAGHLVAGDHRSRVWARAYRRLLFFCAGARTLFDAFVHEQERRADDQVLAWDPGRRPSLRRALYSLATHDFPAAPPRRFAGAPPLGALGHAAWSVQQRLARLSGKAEAPLPGVPIRTWPLLVLALLVAATTSDAGACTLHCLIDSLP